MSVYSDNRVAGEGNLPTTKPAASGVIAGTLFILIALIASWSLATDPFLDMGKVGDDPGPAFIPWIATAFVGLGGLAQVIWSLTEAAKAGGMRSPGELFSPGIWLPLLLIVLMVGYQMAIRPLGFITASVIFAIPAIMMIHWRAGGVFNTRYLVQLPVEAVLIVAGIYLIFSYGIHVSFP